MTCYPLLPVMDEAFAHVEADEFYQGDPKRVEMSLLPQPADSDIELEKDATALYQVADELYIHQRYRIDESPLRIPQPEH